MSRELQKINSLCVKSALTFPPFLPIEDDMTLCNKEMKENSSVGTSKTDVKNDYITMIFTFNEREKFCFVYMSGNLYYNSCGRLQNFKVFDREEFI